MVRLEDLILFVRVAALSSFSDAAREAGVQPAQVSAAIKRLESSLAIRLFARSTRSLRLTPEGEAWLPYARQMLDAMYAGMQKIQAPEQEISGTLQIAVPSDLGRNLLLPVFQAFDERYPALRLRIFSPTRWRMFLRIRSISPFATAHRKMPPISPSPSLPTTAACWWRRPGGSPATAICRIPRR